MAAVLIAIAAMFIAVSRSPRRSEDTVFGLAFLVVLATFVLLFALAGRGEPDLLAAVLRIVPSIAAGGLLILRAAFVQPGFRPVFWLIGPASGLTVTTGDVDGAGPPGVEPGAYQVQVGSQTANFSITC